ncbi:hypothetical protein chiPu_0027492 [Chiloscyllium punctatum]|uniref:Uncharacterized protein n=1 Tax=Chiloscyllium punctatum TaxID=137246 RepID=A0A401TL29_CHIPU|nr:hypothetical protein [Chiloscyllium punctatum]
MGRTKLAVLNVPTPFLVASDVPIVTCIGLNVHSMYLGESAPKELRGLVSLTRAMFVAFGKFIGQVVGLR